MTLSGPELALARLVRDARLAGDHDLPRLFDEYAQTVGVAPLLVYLVDLQQRVLVPFPPPARAGEESVALEVGSAAVGRAYQRGELVTEPLADGATQVWLPLMDGSERLGVIAATVPAPDALDADGGALRTRLLTFAATAAGLVMTKTLVGDTVVRLRRTTPMSLAAETQWATLPPLAFGNGRVTVSGGLEPAYEGGGDTVDYAVDGGTAHLAIFDGMGHGIRSAQLATLAVSAYRHARRAGHHLGEIVCRIDATVAESFDGVGFLTGHVAELDTLSGRLSWVNAGHPPPLLLRGGRVVRELLVEPTLPLGLGGLLDEDPHVGTATLRADDMVLFYSDGVVEARSPGGEFFGVPRLVDMVTRHLAAGLAPPETLRRVIASLLEFQHGQLADDASLLLVQLHGDPAPRRS